MVVSVLAHTAIGLAFSNVDDVEVPPASVRPKRGLLLCTDGLRCKALGWRRPRLGIEPSPPSELSIIQAAIIPRLGMLEQDPKKLPELQMYERPELVEDAINIGTEPPPTVDAPPLMAPEPRPARLDRRVRRRPRGDLSSILGAPDDGDPRRRPTALERIVGRPDGSVDGRGTEFTEGNRWAGRVQLAMSRHFRVPAFIDDRQLSRLRTEFLIRRINARGDILRYDITRRSGNDAYDMAAQKLIHRFMPSEGGTLSLPEPPREVLDYVNRHGFQMVLDGRLFHR